MELLLAACMAAQGYSYTPVPRELFAPPPPMPRVFGVTTTELARRGYTALDGAPSDKFGGNDANSGTDNLNQQELEAWTIAKDGEGAPITVPTPLGGLIAFPSSGCHHDAVKQVYEDVGTWVATDFLRGNLQTFALKRVKGSLELQPADAAWRQCMSGEKVLLALPKEPLSPDEAADLAEEYVANNPGASLTAGVPLSLAALDGQCQDKVGYREQRVDVEDRYLTGFLRHYEDDFAAMDEFYADAATRAQAALLQLE